MKVTESHLPGVLVIEPQVFGDARGFFYESWHRERYREAGIVADFVQDNLSFSQHGVLRGLHFQNPQPQGKLVQVLQGEVFDVAVDIREGSPAFGQWHGELLSAENRRQFYVPPGLAHGFLVTSETALFCYKCTDFYARVAEGAIVWNDPDIGIRWPDVGVAPQRSAKDAAAPRLRDLDSARLVAYRADD
ncbi:MAG: dTDP-4-dehydrorhamnose 3,5-epimerase [Gammaproteobacteria bacterium]